MHSIFPADILALFSTESHYGFISDPSRHNFPLSSGYIVQNTLNFPKRDEPWLTHHFLSSTLAQIMGEVSEGKDKGRFCSVLCDRGVMTEQTESNVRYSICIWSCK